MERVNHDGWQGCGRSPAARAASARRRHGVSLTRAGPWRSPTSTPTRGARDCGRELGWQFQPPRRRLRGSGRWPSSTASTDRRGACRCARQFRRAAAEPGTHRANWTWPNMIASTASTCAARCWSIGRFGRRMAEAGAGAIVNLCSLTTFRALRPGRLCAGQGIAQDADGADGGRIRTAGRPGQRGGAGLHADAGDAGPHRQRRTRPQPGRGKVALCVVSSQPREVAEAIFFLCSDAACADHRGHACRSMPAGWPPAPISPTPANRVMASAQA